MQKNNAHIKTVVALHYCHTVSWNGKISESQNEIVESCTSVFYICIDWLWLYMFDLAVQLKKLRVEHWTYGAEKMKRNQHK